MSCQTDPIKTASFAGVASNPLGDKTMSMASERNVPVGNSVKLLTRNFSFGGSLMTPSLDLGSQSFS